MLFVAPKIKMNEAQRQQSESQASLGNNRSKQTEIINSKMAAVKLENENNNGGNIDNSNDNKYDVLETRLVELESSLAFVTEQNSFMKEQHEQQKMALDNLMQDHHKIQNECVELKKQMKKLTKFVNALARQQFDVVKFGGQPDASEVGV